MDSKVTLVSSHDSNTIQLVFSKNSIINANLIVNGQIRYTISTTDRHAQKTKIIDAITQKDLVLLRKRTFLPDQIVFANREGGAEKKMSDVMKSHKMDDGYMAHMIRTDLGDFYWKIHKVHRLAFFSMSDPTNPIAYREQISYPGVNTFALTILKEYESLLDYIIPTFLYLEAGLRTGEKQADVAEGVAYNNSTLLGGVIQHTTT